MEDIKTQYINIYLPLSVMTSSMPRSTRLSLKTHRPLNHRYGVIGRVIVNLCVRSFASATIRHAKRRHSSQEQREGWGRVKIKGATCSLISCVPLQLRITARYIHQQQQQPCRWLERTLQLRSMTEPPSDVKGTGVIDSHLTQGT